MKIGPKYKIAKRLGASVFDKTQSQKFALSEARHTKSKRRRAPSDYGKQLLEKQKVRMTYGVTEKQFSNYVKVATTKTDANPAEVLNTLLETRLDNVVYRLGLADTRRHARQVVSHGHILVNGKRINVPSHTVKLGDEISVREGSKGLTLFASFSEKNLKAPSWLSIKPKEFTGKVEKAPGYSSVEAAGDFGAVLSYYSR